MMRIEYDTTLGDIADAHLRMVAKSKLVRRSRWQAVCWIAVFVRNKGFQTAESREEFKRAANQRLSGTARKLAVC